MRIIPVIDLLDGVVVRGTGGRRAEYRPVESVLTPDPSPESIAAALASLGFVDVYVADLDAIAGARPAWEVYKTLQRQGLRLWVDAGIRGVAEAVRLADFCADGQALAAIIAGSETLPDPRMLAELLERVGRQRLIFSLDMQHGRPLTPVARWQSLAPEQIAGEVLAAGVRRMILLDLARVGMGQGTTSDELCRALRQQDTDLEIISGGGVRGAADLDRLKAASCDAALVASAIHDGHLTGQCP